jgi:hypothetical protein
MIIKVPDNQLGVGSEFVVLNAMTELITFKRFIGKSIAISVNMESLRATAEKEM